MKAAVLHTIEQPLQIQDVDLEVLTNEVTAEVLVAGLNRRDHWISRGMYAGIELPCILGSDALVKYEGKKYIVNPNENWGTNPRFPSKAYKIRGMEKQGTLAQYISVDRQKLFAKPEFLTDVQAAVLPLGGLTAYRALISNGKIQAGDKVLINGVGGGVAMLAFQFALAMKADVYVSSSSPEKINQAISLGAKGGVNYKENGWGKSIRKKMGGFDIIIDSAGGTGFPELISAAAPGCRICIYGGTRGNIGSISPQALFFKQIHILGSTMGNDQEFADMVQLVTTYSIKPIVDATYELTDVNQAFHAMLDRDKFGKIAVSIC